jgi:diaminopimelate epimerase
MSYQARRLGVGLPFEKWHGAGNDFVIADARSGAPWHHVILESDGPVSEIAQTACDRHFGIGADGLLLATDDPHVGIAMRMWNPDGSESEMCGNGLRCVGAWLHARGEFAPGPHQVMTGAGKLTVLVARNGQVSVDMGRPGLASASIPVQGATEERAGLTSVLLPSWEQGDVRATCVSMGNPHAVIFVAHADEVPLETFGPMVERNESFPNRTNLEVCTVVDRSAVVVRVWERGVGATLACGTGACAVMVAARLRGLVDHRAEIRLPGGTLVAEWPGGLGNTGHSVLLSGPAVRTFAGTWFGG